MNSVRTSPIILLSSRRVKTFIRTFARHPEVRHGEMGTFPTKSARQALNAPGAQLAATGRAVRAVRCGLGRGAAGYNRGVTRWVLHVDLDQFIAAVEVLRHPELRGKPVVVGGDGDPNKRGVVSTASYEARELGVHSGLPLRTAKKRCPDCIFLPVDAPAYLAVSAEIMEVLRDTGAPVEVLGWDEAFVGIEAADPESFARDLAVGVKEATRLDCSVGIGQNKLQAKIATGFGKPAGVLDR